MTAQEEEDLSSERQGDDDLLQVIADHQSGEMSERALKEQGKVTEKKEKAGIASGQPGAHHAVSGATAKSGSKKAVLSISGTAAMKPSVPPSITGAEDLLLRKGKPVPVPVAAATAASSNVPAPISTAEDALLQKGKSKQVPVAGTAAQQATAARNSNIPASIAGAEDSLLATKNRVVLHVTHDSTSPVPGRAALALRNVHQDKVTAEVPPLPLSTTSEAEPGAYQARPGSSFVPNNDIRFSLVGATPSMELAREQLRGSVTYEMGSTPSEQLRGSANYDMGSAPLDRPSSANNNNRDLSVARLVDEERQDLPQAEQFRARNKTNPRNTLILVGLGVLLAAVVVLLSVLLATRDNEAKSDTPSEGTPSTESTIGLSTLAPTTTIMMTDPGTYLLRLLPDYTQDAIREEPNSPQQLAYVWMINDPSLAEYAEWRIVQRYALAVFYYATGGEDSWTFTDRWLSYDAHECRWFNKPYFELVELYMQASSFVKNNFIEMYSSKEYPCQNFHGYAYGNESNPITTFMDAEQINHVAADGDENNRTGIYTHMWLYLNNLVGAVPRELYLLTGLKSLSLAGNPDLQLTLTSDMGQLQKLEAVELSAMGVDGAFPSQIGLMTNFATMLMQYNKISGSIPTQIGTMSSLAHITLEQNALTGPLPSEMGVLSDTMNWFYFFGNQMTGSLPSEFGGLTGLQYLNSWGNKFTGAIPTQIGRLSQLYIATFHENMFTGTLPSQIARLTDCWVGLSFNNNFLTGTIPTQLGLLTSLRGAQVGSGTYTFGLSNNQLTGSIPTEFGLMTSVERMWLHNNRLTGPIPSQIGLLSNHLFHFLAHNNNLSGTIPPEVEWVSSFENSTLTEFNVVNNTNLAGQIPESLCPLAFFDCSDSLCGCNCSCSQANATF